MPKMTAEELFDFIRDYCYSVGESPYELLDTRRFAIPYEQYLREYYPQIFSIKNQEDYTYYNWENLSPFDLECLFLDWALGHMDQCPYGEDFKEWEWEEMEFSKAMVQAGLAEEVKSILITGE